MKLINVFKVSFVSFFLISCSNKEPDVISKIKSMQIPVVQVAKCFGDKKQDSLNYLHYKNMANINNLTIILKNGYIKGSDSKEIFDMHSQAHQAYIALTTLEQAGMVNETYYNDKNIQGLKALNGVLSQVSKEINSQSI
ncbi:hypothetical protein [Enterobacter kobei]